MIQLEAGAAMTPESGTPMANSEVIPRANRSETTA